MENKKEINVEKQVTFIEVVIRLCLIFSPVILPQFLATDKMSKIIIPTIWFAIFGPVFLMPHLNYDNWSENAKPFFWIFKSIFFLYMMLLIGWAVMYVFFGKVHYS